MNEFKEPLLDLKHRHGFSTSQLAQHIGVPTGIIRSALYTRAWTPVPIEYLPLLQKIALDGIRVLEGVPEPAAEVATPAIPIVFTGIIQDCWNDYKKKLEDTSECEKLLSALQISEHTLRRWMRDSYSPEGINLMRLGFYLENLGYVITGFLCVPSEIREIAHLLADHKLTTNEVLRELQVSHHTLLRKFRGVGVGSHADEELLLRCRTLIQLVREKSNAWNETTRGEKKNGLKQLTTSTESSSVLVPVLNECPVRKSLDFADGEVVAGSAQHLGDCVAAIIASLNPLARYVLSDAFGEEERRKLRRIIGAEEIFEIANMLNALCSEHARKIYLQR